MIISNECVECEGTFQTHETIIVYKGKSYCEECYREELESE